MATPYTPTIRTVVPGEAVSAGVTNRPTGDLAQRTQHLKERLDALSAGRAIVDAAVTLQAGMPVGTPVYIVAATNTYAPAVVSPGSLAVGGIADPAAFVVGVVASKQTDTIGDIVLGGRVSLTTVEWAAVMDTGVFTPGPLYASANLPGKMSSSRGALSVYIGYMTESGDFIVAPRSPSAAEHSHSGFVIVGAPAGSVTDPTPGNTHSIATPNPANRGWLPANATYFPGWVVGVQIPTGAKFGYNLAHSSEASLRGQFPPVPVESAIATQGGLTVSPSPLLINSYGIWWMSDTYGEAPWPVDYAISSAATDIHLWITKAANTSNGNFVTSLTRHPDSTVNFEIVNPSNAPATQGPLQLRFLGLLSSGGNTTANGAAVKTISGGTFTTGPATDRILAGSGVTISATHGDGTNGYYGTITISASAGNGSFGEGILASAATIATASDFRFVQFLNGVSTSVVWELTLGDGAPLSATVTPKLWLYTAVNGVLPATFTYETKILTPSPSGALLGSPAWSSPAAVPSVTPTLGTVFSIDLPNLTTVPKNSRILLRINRSAADTYAGVLGVLRTGFSAV